MALGPLRGDVDGVVSQLDLLLFYAGVIIYLIREMYPRDNYRVCACADTRTRHNNKVFFIFSCKQWTTYV